MVSAIIAALSAGATVLASGALGEAGKEAYKALKQAVLRFASPSDVEKLEQKPGSQSRQGVLAEALDEAGKAEDPGLAQLAQALMDALKEAGAPGVSLKGLEAINVQLERITATGAGVSGEDWKLKGDLKISGVDAGATPGKPPWRQG